MFSSQDFLVRIMLLILALATLLHSFHMYTGHGTKVKYWWLRNVTYRKKLVCLPTDEHPIPLGDIIRIPTSSDLKQWAKIRYMGNNKYLILK